MTDKRLYHEVAEKIKGLIRDGAFPPGSRLPGERELAERFNVSRVTVRDAEIGLQALSYITIKTGSGVYVQHISKKDGPGLPDISAFDLTQARLLFESEAASLAALHISDAELAHLEELVQKIAHDNPNGEDASQKADREFHLAIAAASGNEAVKYTIENLWKIRNEQRSVAEVYAAICEIEDATERHQEHAAVLAALRDHNPITAREAMQEHFTRLLESMIDLTEAQAVERHRQSATESRERYLGSEKRRRHA